MSKLDNLKRTRRRRNKIIQRLTKKLAMLLERRRLTDADIGYEVAKRERTTNPSPPMGRASRKGNG